MIEVRSFCTVKNNYAEERDTKVVELSRTCVSQWTIDPKCHRLSLMHCLKRKRREEEEEEEGLSTHYVTSHPLANEKEKARAKKVNTRTPLGRVQLSL